jgi:hypothetical protein
MARIARSSRQERAFYHGLQTGDYTLLLVRFEIRDCPKGRPAGQNNASRSR